MEQSPNPATRVEHYTRTISTDLITHDNFLAITLGVLILWGGGILAFSYLQTVAVNTLLALPCSL